VAAKRNPQTAAKRAREQALREKRERKAQKKQDAILRKLSPPENEPEAADGELDEAGAEPAEPAE
jgi:hypothetical protein